MEITSQETTLLNAFRLLPPEAADELSAFVQRLADHSVNTRIDWSDSWSDEDLRAFTAHSLKRIEAEEDH